jgi:hypothetical protein
LAVFVVVTGGCSWRREPDGTHDSAVVLELSRRNVSVGGGTIFTRKPSEGDRESVEGAELGIEVNLSGEDLGQGDRELRTLSCLLHRLVQRGRRAADKAGGIGHRQRSWNRPDLCVESIGTDSRLDPQQTVFVNLVFEVPKFAIFCPLEDERL